MAAETRWRVWVLEHRASEGTLERLGDARAAADKLGCDVGVLLVGEDGDAEKLIQHGADEVALVTGSLGPAARVTTAEAVLRQHAPRLVIAPGDAAGREWAARLAARNAWLFASPALTVKASGERLEVTALDRSERFARKVVAGAAQTVVITLKDGVGEPRAADVSRSGEVTHIRCETASEVIDVERVIPADPATVDIRFASRLVAGGRGLGGKEGFDKLRRFAAKLGAGVAASRMAVDLGWIEHERQVGQTGKTVKPDLYIACGISGASHHLEGMSDAKHIIAINTDPNAPIFAKANLGLIAGLYEVLERAERGMAEPEA